MISAFVACRGLAFLALIIVLVVPGPGFPADYPARSVRIIYPSTAGSTGDVRTRALAERLSQRLGQRFMVENKPGAGTTIGTALVAAAPADGYTLLATFTPAFPIGHRLYKSAGYDPEKSFTPIAVFSRGSPLLVVRPSFPARTLKEFVDLAKANPAQVTLAHGGAGGANHIPAELFVRASAVQVVMVPYKGEAAALPDVIGGQVDGLFAYTAAAVPLIKAGKVRALAVAGRERNSSVPDVPTFMESGYPAYHYDASMILVGPVGVPREVVMLLNREIAAILQQAEMRATYEATGATPVISSPEEASELIRREVEINAVLAKDLAITAD